MITNCPDNINYCDTFEEMINDFKNYQANGTYVIFMYVNTSTAEYKIKRITEDSIIYDEYAYHEIREKEVKFSNILGYSPYDLYKVFFDYKDNCKFQVNVRTGEVLNDVKVIALGITYVILESINDASVRSNIYLKDITKIVALNKETGKQDAEYNL